MFTLQYYDTAWGGFRRFDTFGDTAYPARVQNMEQARKVASDYAAASALNCTRVRVLDDEGQTVCVIRKYKNNSKAVETTA